MKLKKLYELMKIKAGLLADGIFIPKAILDRLISEGKTLSGTGLFKYHLANTAPNEIHIRLNKDGIMKVEVRQKNNKKETPFRVLSFNNKLYLYDGLTRARFPVYFPELPKYLSKKTKNGQIMKNVVRPMGENYLRVYPDMRCDFAMKESERCRFCGGIYKKVDLSDRKIIEDLKETFLQASKEINVKGIFMSTGSFKDSKRIKFYASVLSLIKKNFPKREIIFSLAPQINKEFIKLLQKSAGSNLMLSYNMEAYDDSRWDINSKFCMGIAKAKQTKNFYFDSFKIATEILGKGNIKSNFIIGLESIPSLEKGIRDLSKRGVSSSGTIFYLTPGSPWYGDKKLKGYLNKKLDFFNSAKKRDFIVKAYVLMASIIRDNNLRFPWNPQSRISGLEWDVLDYINLKNENSKSC